MRLFCRYAAGGSPPALAPLQSSFCPECPFRARVAFNISPPRRLLVQLYPGLVVIGCIRSTWTEEPTFAFENDPESIRLLPAKDPS
jgi:hypothetical protein